MSPDTGGPIRGFFARWLVRFQAVRGILGMVTSSVTAASTLTFALQSLGYAYLAPYALGIGISSGVIFAWAYVRFGLYNRKNRENSDRGANWAGPDAYINGLISNAGIFYSINGRPPTQEEIEELKESMKPVFEEYRDGIEIND